MSGHRFILEPYNGMKSRHSCPSCQHRNKTFSLYIDTVTSEYVHSSVGRCNRENNCGNHYTPKQYFQDNNVSFDRHPTNALKPKSTIPQSKPISCIPIEVFKASLNTASFETNDFVKFLVDLLGVAATHELVSRYFLATSKHWNGATVFWQIDAQGKVRTGKIMLYSPNTGKRVKEPFNHIQWTHKSLKLPDFELKQCFFGEHLLIDKTKPVALVESEKTAVIASVYFPQFIWLAVGGLTNLNSEKCSALRGRTVSLFPDLNGYEKWSQKAKELSHIATFTVSDLLERKATEDERKLGLDLADYLVKFDYKAFTVSESKTIKPTPVVQSLVEVKSFEFIEPTFNFNKPEQHESESWKLEISELEKYFSEIKLPTHSIKLHPCSTITNVSLFIESHFRTVKANNGKRKFIPYLNRMQELKQILTTNLN